MGTDSGQPGDPWGPAEKGGGWGEAPTSPGSPVGPPPPAPEGPQPGPAYGGGPYGAGPYGGADFGPQGPYGPQGGQPGYAPGYPGYPGGAGYGGYGQPGWGGQPPPSQGTATASMVLGIVGLVLVGTCWGSFLGIFVAPVALFLGVSARRKADRGEGGGRSYATSGFVMGIIGTVLSVIVAAIIVVTIVMAENADNSTGGPSGGDYYDALRVPVASVTGR